MKYILILAIAAFLNSCDSTSSSDDKPSDVIIPLAIGNTWQIKITDRRGADSVAQTRLKTMRVTESTTIGGQPWYRISSDSLSDGYYYINRADGHYVLPNTQWPVEFALKLLPYPASIGTTLRGAPDVDDSLYVKSTDTSITTSAGTFSCYHYLILSVENNEIRHRTDAYYSPNIGLIFYRSYLDENGVIYISEEGILESYQLK